MASFASSATTCGARKHAWTNYQIEGQAQKLNIKEDLKTQKLKNGRRPIKLKSIWALA